MGAPALPEGSLILVTGATSLISGQIIYQLLKRGYKVRGAVRDLAKAEWLANDLFKDEAANGLFELALVEDMAADQAFDTAIRGVHGVVHVASDTSFSDDPNKVITPSVAGTNNVLQAAAKEGSVRRFVVTSSVAAAGFPFPGVKWHLDKNSWNDWAIETAWSPPPYDGRGAIVYSAAKTAGEKAVWKFIEEEKPNFVANAVLPFVVIGPVLHEKQNPSTSSLVFGIYHGATSFHMDHNIMAYVDINDVAILHVAALLDPEVENERLNAWTESNNWVKLQAAFHKLFPEKDFSKLPEESNMIGTVDDKPAKELLKKWTSQDDWTSVEQTVKNTLEGKKPAALTLGYSYP